MSLANLPEKCLIGKSFEVDRDIEGLYESLLEGEKIMETISSTSCEGYIIQKMTKAPKLDSSSMLIAEEEILIYDDFQPYLWKKCENLKYLAFNNFDRAVDEFYSKLETQKLEQQNTAQNKEAVKKLENVKKDHQKRIEELKLSQSEDELKAKLIEYNLELVDHAIYLVNSAIANQLSWTEINEIIQDAKDDNHPVALAIKQLKLDVNHIILTLIDPEGNIEFKHKINCFLIYYFFQI
jgi:predicted ribosome quality control (RQC) complex YloA/Tae2 family protein